VFHPPHVLSARVPCRFPGLSNLIYASLVCVLAAGLYEPQVEDDEDSCLMQSLSRSTSAYATGTADFTWQRFPHASHALRELDKAYKGHATDPSYIKVKERKAEELVQSLDEPVEAAAYGEILPTSIIRLLDHVDARPGQRYYDLGSGFGKTVLLAALLGFNATGVELVDQRWGAACSALQEAKSGGLRRDDAKKTDASFKKGSFLDIDFSDADVVFTASVFWTPEMMNGIADHAKMMKPGGKIITAGMYEDMHPYNGGLQGPAFSKPTSFVAPSTWSNTSQWLIYEVLEQKQGDVNASLLGVKDGAKSAKPFDTCCLEK